MTAVTGPVLEHKLSDDGFRLGYEEEDKLEFVLVRPSKLELFERIQVSHGNRGKIATVGIEVSLVPGRTALKGLCIHRCLLEVASDPTTGWTAVEDEDSGKALINRIAATAARACSDFTNEVGQCLAEGCEDARSKAKQYLRLIESGELDRLPEPSLEPARNDISRIMKQHIVCIPNGAKFYEIALLAIAGFCSQVEGERDWLRSRNADTTTDRGLMIRLQYMASRLADEPGWPIESARQRNRSI